MLENNEASVARCEDVNDFNRMKFNGKIMSWLEFKEQMKKKGNNPWIFDDIIETRKDEEIKEKFNIAWSVIGRRSCEDVYKDSGIKYIPYNKTVLQIKEDNPKNYISLIDSSGIIIFLFRVIYLGSMRGQRWKELCQSLKKTLQRAQEQNPKNKVTIINFSDQAIIEVEDREPGSINIDALSFQNSGTNFETAFAKGFEIIKRIRSNDIILLFMTDGYASYPSNSLNLIKNYIKGSGFKSMNIKFGFHAIGFHSNSDSDILKQIATAMEGATHFAQDEVSLTQTYIEILNRKE